MALEDQGEAVGRPRVLMVQDRRALQTRVLNYLTDNGFAVAVTDQVSQVEAAVAAKALDMAVLDIDLPGCGGLAACRRLANWGAPSILAIGAFEDAIERIVALESGVDDCLSKPVNPRELAARVRAVLRGRGLCRTDAALGPLRCEFAGFVLDLPARTLTDPVGRAVALNPSEYGMLLTFLGRPGTMLSRSTVRQAFGGAAERAGDRMVDGRVRRLRRQLGACGHGLIRVARGGGYALDAEVCWR